MAKGVINLQKESGGVTKITSTDGIGNTEVVLPESGNIVSVDTAVTGNAIARYDGTTGKLQNSVVYIDDTGILSSNYFQLGNTSTAVSKSINSYYVGVNEKITLNLDINKIYKISIHIAGTSSSNGSIYFARYNGTIFELKTHIQLSSLVRPTLIVDTDGLIKLQQNNSTSAYNITVITESLSYTSTPGNLSFDLCGIEGATSVSNGNVLLTSGTGGLGYGTGAGGTVTQLTSKGTAVTLNKPSGQITMSNAILTSGSLVAFFFYNSLLSTGDNIILTLNGNIISAANYQLSYWTGDGVCTVSVKNVSAGNLSEAVGLKFTIIKGAVS